MQTNDIQAYYRRIKCNSEIIKHKYQGYVVIAIKTAKGKVINRDATKLIGHIIFNIRSNGMHKKINKITIRQESDTYNELPSRIIISAIAQLNINGTTQQFKSSGLGNVDGNDQHKINIVKQEQLEELESILMTIGFTPREINKAYLQHLTKK